MVGDQDCGDAGSATTMAGDGDWYAADGQCSGGLRHQRQLWLLDFANDEDDNDDY